jgi:hypothetical protein
MNQQDPAFAGPRCVQQPVEHVVLTLPAEQLPSRDLNR